MPPPFFQSRSVHFARTTAPAHAPHPARSLARTSSRTNKKGRAKDAEEYFLLAAKYNPGSFPAAYDLGLLYLQQVASVTLFYNSNFFNLQPGAAVPPAHGGEGEGQGGGMMGAGGVPFMCVSSAFRLRASAREIRTVSRQDPQFLTKSMFPNNKGYLDASAEKYFTALAADVTMRAPLHALGSSLLRIGLVRACARGRPPPPFFPA